MSTRRPVSRVPTPVPAENGANGGRNSVVLGPKDRLVGQLYIEGDLQVSGTVDSLGADSNSRVKKDQVVARLETSTFDARLSQARANLVAARANVEKAKSTVADTKQKYERAKELSAYQQSKVYSREDPRIGDSAPRSVRRSSTSSPFMGRWREAPEGLVPTSFLVSWPASCASHRERA